MRVEGDPLKAKNSFLADYMLKRINLKEAGERVKE